MSNLAKLNLLILNWQATCMSNDEETVFAGWDPMIEFTLELWSQDHVLAKKMAGMSAEEKWQFVQENCDDQTSRRIAQELDFLIN